MTGYPSAQARPSTETRRSLWIPWALCGIFAVFLIANGTMLYFAARTWTGLETESAYQKGLAYNDALNAAEGQAALDWQVELEAGLSAPDEAWVEVGLRDRDGHAIVAEQVWARLVRPTHEGYDREVPLTAVDAGRYRGFVALPLAGQWDLRVRVEHRGGVHRSSRRLFLKSDD